MQSYAVEAFMKELSASLICAICKDYYHTPVIISTCSHNFCSLCIRRYFTIKQECPICGLDASLTDLFPNGVLSTILKHFETLRSLLHAERTTTGNTVKTHLNVKSSITAVSSQTNISHALVRDVMKSTYESPETSQDDCFVVESTPEFSLGLKEFSTQSQGFNMGNPVDKTILAHSQTTETLQKNQKHYATEEGKASFFSCTSDSVPNLVSRVSTEERNLQGDPEKAECPVCGLSVRTSLINSHLDGCLAREEKKKALRQNTPKRRKRNDPPVTKLAYNLLSLRALRQKMRELGLPTQGDKEELKWRHQEFVTKYHAEMDKTEPRGVAILIDELKREEKRRKSLEASTSRLKKSSTIPADNEEKMRQNYLEKHAKQYKELEDLARQSLPPKRQKRSSSTDDCTPGCSSTKNDGNSEEVLRETSKNPVSLGSEGFCPDSMSSTTSTSLDCLQLKTISESPKGDW